MAPYILAFLFFLFLAIQYEITGFPKKFFLGIVFLVLAIFSGLKGPSVSIDYATYQRMFDYLDELSVPGSVLPTFEPGFVFIVRAFKTLDNMNYGAWIMLFFAVSSLALKLYSFNKLFPNPFIISLFYFSHYFFLHEVTQIRIGLGAAIFFFAFTFYIDGRKWIFVLLILIASLFHYSAILYLTIFLFDNKYIRRGIFLIMISLSIVLAAVKLPVLNFIDIRTAVKFSGKVSQYTRSVEGGLATSINVFNVYTVTIMLCSLYYILFIPWEKLKENRILLLALKFSVFSIFILALLSGVPTVAFRFSELFAIADIFLLGFLIYYLPFGRSNLIFVVFLAMAIFSLTVFYSDAVQPFKFIQFR